MRSPSVALLALAALAAGCASPDPSGELRDASRLVADRAALAPEWASVGPGSTHSGSLPSPLDLATATRRALERHPTLRAEVAAVAAARADLAQADRLPNPRLGLSFGIPIDGGGGDPLMAGVMTPIAGLWTRPARLAAAEAGLREAALALADRALRAIEGVRAAFAAVHHGRARAEIDRRAAGIAAERLALAESLAAAGEAARPAVDALSIELARARDRALRSEEEAALAERALLELLGAADLAQCPPLDPAGLDASPAVPSEPALVRLAAEQRLDVAAARARARAAEEGVSVARRERFGDVEARVEFARDMDDREFIHPGIDIALPLFDRGDARVARAAAEAERAAREAEAVESEAVREVRSAHASFLGARARLVGIDEGWLAAARSRARLAALTAAAGEATSGEALMAALDEAEAERERNDAALALRVARFALERSAGGALWPLAEAPPPGGGDLAEGGSP